MKESLWKRPSYPTADDGSTGSDVVKTTTDPLFFYDGAASGTALLCISLVATPHGHEYTMSSFAKEMSFYTAYHQENTNVWIHVLGVPTITFTAFIPLAWLELFQLGGMPITAATLLYLYSVQYYLRTDLLFGSIATVLYGVLLYAAHAAAAQGYAFGWALFAVGQLAGWSAQIFGHLHHEGNKPAFFESIYQSFISAPLFVIADLCFHFGIKRELQDEIHQELINSGRLRKETGNFFQPHQA